MDDILSHFINYERFRKVKDGLMLNSFKGMEFISIFFLMQRHKICLADAGDRGALSARYLFSDYTIVLV